MLLLLLSCTGDPTPTAETDPPDSSADTDTAPPDPCAEVDYRTDPGVDPTAAPALVFEGDRPSNLLLISIDTLRRDRIGRFDARPSPVDTPFLDGLLAGGVSLDDHRSCANWTLDAMTCALSGRYAWDLDYAPSNGPGLNGGRDVGGLPEGAELLADWLDRAGYATALSSANPYLSTSYNMVAGYDDWVGLDTDAGALADELMGLYDALAPEGPWLLHLHAMEPHAPWDPPAEYTPGLDALEPIDWDLGSWAGVSELDAAMPELDEATLALALAHVDARYDGEIAWLDDALQALFDEMDGRGLMEDTLVVVWSDHGEQFNEHGEFRHGSALFTEETAAIAGFWARGLQPAAWDGPTTHADLVPTVLDALGLDPAEIAPGVDFTGAIAGTARSDRPRFAECLRYGSTHVSADVGAQRMIFDWEDGAIARFDRASDPGEAADLHAPGDPESAALWDAALGPLVERVGCLIEVEYPAAEPSL